MSKTMTKYQLDHFEKKVKRHFDPLIEEQELLVKQYRTEATKYSLALSKFSACFFILYRTRPWLYVVISTTSIVLFIWLSPLLLNMGQLLHYPMFLSNYLFDTYVG